MPPKLLSVLLPRAMLPGLHAPRASTSGPRDEVRRAHQVRHRDFSDLTSVRCRGATDPKPVRPHAARYRVEHAKADRVLPPMCRRASTFAPIVAEPCRSYHSSIAQAV